MVLVMYKSKSPSLSKSHHEFDMEEEGAIKPL